MTGFYMYTKLKKLLVFPLMIAALMTQAQAIEMRGQVAYSYEGGLFSDNPTDKDKAQALKAAKMMALKKYFSSLGPAQQKLLRELQPRIEANPDEFLTGTAIVAEDVNKSMKVYNLVVRAEINEELIKSELKLNIPSNAIASGDGSAISALFVARRITSTKQFSERQTTVTQEQAELSSGYSDGMETLSKTQAKSSGGNVVRKASRNTYGKLSSTDFDAAFNDVMTSNGFETIDYADVASECAGPAYSQVQSAFMKTDELPQNLRKQVINAAKKCEIRYLAIGYLNVSAPTTDSVSGNRKVIVSVNGMVWDVKKRLPRKVGSVGPVQAFGLGPDDDTARRVALDVAAKKAADVIASQLGVKNIQ